MAVELATAYISLVPSAKGIGGAIEKELTGSTSGAAAAAGQSIEKGMLPSLGKVAAAVGGSFAIAKVVDFGKASIDAAQESAKVAAQTESVIKSTGASAGVTSTHVGSLANSLKNVSGVSDETIQSGENMLLTFTNVRNGVGKSNQIFDQATSTMLDMSVALGQDTSSSALQLGKALNDPIAGVGALSRVGVTFTDQQKDQIKALVDSGKTMDAQKIILGELNKEFGGSAKAVGATLTPLDRLKLKFDDVQEVIGAKLITAMNTAADILGKVLPRAIEIVRTAFDKVRAVVEPVIRFLGDHLPETGAALAAVGGLVLAVVVPPFLAWAAATAAAAAATVIAAAPVIALVAGVALLAAGVVYAYRHVEIFRDIVNTAGTVLKEVFTRAVAVATVAVEAVIDVVKSVVKVIQGVVDVVVGIFTGDWSRAWEGLQKIVGGAIDGVIAVVGGFVKQIGSALGDLPGTLLGWVTGAVKTVVTKLPSLIVDFIKWWAELHLKVFGALVALGEKLVGWARDGFVALVSALPGLIVGLVKFYAELHLKAVAALIAVGSQLISWAGDGFRALVGALPGLAGGVLSFFAGLPQKMIDAAGNVPSIFTGFGKSVIDFVVKGLEAAKDGILKVAAVIFNPLIDIFNDTIGRLPGVPNIPKLHQGMDKEFSGVRDTIKGRFDEAVTSVNTALGGLTNKTWNGPTVVPITAAGLAAVAGVGTAVQTLTRQFFAGPTVAAQTGPAGANLAAVDASARNLSAQRFAGPTVSANVSPALSAINSIATAVANAARGITTSIGAFGRASGGPVTAGRPYVVGEDGPELFVPKVAGMIVPNDRLQSQRSVSQGPWTSGGGTSVYVAPTVLEPMNEQRLVRLIQDVDLMSPP